MLAAAVVRESVNLDAREWQAKWLSRLLLPEGGYLAFYQAFLDESERPGGVFCVAGFVFVPLQLDKFSAEWHRLMAPYWPFHMAELVAGRDKRRDRPTKFESLSTKQRDVLLQRAVALIRRRITLALSVSCNVHDVKSLGPGLRGFRNAYSVCCYACCVLLANWIIKRESDARAAYVFEAGHRFQAEANFLVGTLGADPVLSERHRYESHAFVQKERSAPLQAADLYAWELSKFMAETVFQKTRRPRASLRALVGADVHRYVGRHLSEATLRRYFDEIRALDLKGKGWWR